MHNGIKLNSNAIEAIENLTNISKKIVFLSNAPRPSLKVINFLLKMGMDKKYLSSVITSGEAAMYAINQNKFGLNSLKDKFRKELKNSAKLYLKNNKDIPKVGSLFKNLAYSNLLDYLGNYEKKITGSRNTKFNKLHNAFYKGDIANSILKSLNTANAASWLLALIPHVIIY